MGVYKRGKTYWYKFVFNGHLFRESTRQGNATVARQMEAAHRTSLAKGEVGLREKKAAPTFEDFCTKRITPYAEGRGKSVWYGAGINALVKFEKLANSPLDEITSEVAAAFAAHRQDEKIQPCSINSALRVLRRILRLAMEWKVIPTAPKIEMLKGETRRERVVTFDEEIRYLAACAGTLNEVASLLFDSGLRPDELHRMAWEHQRWDSGGRFGSIFVSTGKTKAARRSIPMSKRVRALLEKKWKDAGKPETGWVWPADTASGHVNHSTFRRPHSAALKLCKVRPFVLYSLRHTFLTRLGASGCDVWTLMKIAGHSNIQQSMAYIH